MQSFLASLNFYNPFIEDFTIYVAILYELKEVDYHRPRERNQLGKSPNETSHEAELNESDLKPGSLIDRTVSGSEGHIEQPMVAFSMLKAKMVLNPILKHFDPEKIPVVI